MHGSIEGSTNCTPQAKASTAGAMPKLMTSASESISRPKSLVVLVMRAMRPSRPSRKTASADGLGRELEMWRGAGRRLDGASIAP